ncbi:MAG: bifunctional homocysteine S-methyltransferase/methylenetetrahydrofolate reductase [Planctomycetaceae bacterium]|jgi:homocysteine S-methyltransferase|nr:bifunctional homocysteine S-methyltransferase/methylenetetrahydrofolate reductase [Planctomycetaceae bacterium]
MTKNTIQKSFSEKIREQVMVFDGPMGTELYRNHVFTNRCYGELNLTDPNLVRRIHQSYLDAGADVMTTNTFGTHRSALEKYGLADKMTAIHQAGVEIVREVIKNSGTPVSIAGSIGHLSVAGHSQAGLREEIIEQAKVLFDSGADFILFETLSSRELMEICVQAMSHPETSEIPYILSCAMVHGGESISGETIQRLFMPFSEEFSQPSALGINCGLGPDGILEAVEQAVHLTHFPLVIQPNAGTPREVEGRSIYHCSPEYLATYAMRYINLGVAAVGGCCGTTPEHIQEIAKMIKPLSRARLSQHHVLQQVAPEVEEKEESPFAERSRLAWKLANKQWVTTVEIVPPRGYDLSAILEKCRILYRHGIDAINLPDGPRASSRIASLVVAEKIQREAKVETILHVCCRDKNLIGMQADLLGAAALGIRNLLFITGDPPKLGLYPDATGVFDTDSIGITAVQKRLNRGVDLGGQAIDPPTHCVIGVGLDPTALDKEREIDRFRKKVESGAEFAITQPVFDPEELLAFLKEIDSPIPVIAGIWPLASYRNAVFMQNEVPGVTIPEETMRRMEAVSAQSRENQLAAGVEIARESVQKIRGHVSGIQVSAPFGRIEIALAVAEGESP